MDSSVELLCGDRRTSASAAASGPGRCAAPGSLRPTLVGGRRMGFDRPMTDALLLDPPTQASLIRAVAEQRDRDAFGRLFRYFAPRVKAYLLRLGSDDGAAEEIAQEAMVTVWRKAGTFDPSQASVSTWVFTIARNKRIDGLRRTRRPELDPEDPALRPEAGPAADRLFDASQRDERLRQALKLLPEEQAEVVRLAFFEDKAHAAIADETDLPLGTVKSRLRLALTRLRRALAAEGIDQV